MTCGQITDSARNNGLLTSACVLNESGPANATNVPPGLTRNHLVGGDCMAHKAHNAPSAHTQRFIDPIISQARLINESAAIDRALAARKALRPKRSAAASKGWEVRRG